ncbi:MAG: prepilin-type N-terminal cleavage/methylation domain-containing protein, partial [Desulfuromonadales bacterium]
MTVFAGDGRERGFTLVELLVVAAIMGLVVMASYSLYQNNQRSNLKQDDMVELQQNLRIAMEQIRRDVILAGFMCPQGTAVASAPQFSFNSNPNSDADCSDASDLPGSGGDCFTIRTASTRGIGARIALAAPFDSPANPETEVAIPVASDDMADLLRPSSSGATSYLRILRPGDFGQPVEAVLEVTDVTDDMVTVKGFNSAGTYRTGYMMVRVT